MYLKINDAILNKILFNNFGNNDSKLYAEVPNN